MLHRVLHSSVKGQSKQISDQKSRGLVSAMCKIVNIRNCNLNAYQKLVGLCLRTSGTSKKTISKLSKLYDTVSYTTLTSLLDTCAEKSRAKMGEWAGEEVVHCGDNLDIRSKVRFEVDGVSCHDVHLYNNMVYKSRVPVSHLSDEIPIVDLQQIDYSVFLLSSSEEEEILNLFKYHIMNSWNTMLGGNLKVDEPFNKYSSEMKNKSEKVCSLCSFVM